jgi:hypothetical protein
MVKFLAAHSVALRDTWVCHDIVGEALTNKNALRIFNEIEASYCVYVHSYRDKDFLIYWVVDIYLFKPTLSYFLNILACNVSRVFEIGNNDALNSDSYYVLSYEEKLIYWLTNCRFSLKKEMIAC